ncbi:hypothetical protein VA7868_00466 [Vibrio aerogenes CECT 7868]|uniref:Esterase PHB depolymerase n=1 Tax=Vibrio aerogenes CECT 7868 TaxID=1216006 RepID=A0A1M5VNR3_9VIBR|nr:poly(3-hydroxybutyrate) depolymerase [Vibrio aerogenes]SHH76901.1 hypothetical protein VA7868_00466 [Vibrio aerogenes CECT 7868]
MKKNKTNPVPARYILSALLFPLASYATDKLPAVGAEISNTSVSGLSSGAFMTTQFFVAHSAIMQGAGIIAGGPYLCAQSWPTSSYLENAMNTCMNPLTKSSGPNTPLLVKKTRQLAKSGKIDPVENLKKDHLYLFSGSSDKTVSTLVMDQTRNFYQSLGVTDIFYNHNTNAGHAMITANAKDSTCSATKPPFVNNCDIPQAKNILKTIYPGLNTSKMNQSAKAIPFDQSEFIKAPYTSMDKTGYVYIPGQCKKGTHCGIHVVFHGCEQGATVIQDKYYNQTGYNAYADANNLIMLYPQVHPSTDKPYNPKGCWDFWGYSSPDNPEPDYFTKKSPQISAVYRMVERLSSKP